MRSQSRIEISPLPIVAAVFGVTLLPLLLDQAGFSFHVPAHSSGWASGDTRLQFDVVTLALALFVALATWFHLRIDARRGVLVLGAGVVLAGLANGVLLVPDHDRGALEAALAARAAGMAVIFTSLALLASPCRPRRLTRMVVLGAVGVPAVALVWLGPLLLADRLAQVGTVRVGGLSLAAITTCAPAPARAPSRPISSRRKKASLTAGAQKLATAPLRPCAARRTASPSPAASACSNSSILPG